MRLGLPAAALLALVITGCGGDAATSEPQQASVAELTGTVTYRERMALRMDSVITVRLSDVSLMDVPSIRLAEESIEARGKSVPVSFRLSFDPRRIEERNTYAVSAEIRSGDGKLLWVSDTMTPVLTRGAPATDIEIMLVRSGD